MVGNKRSKFLIFQERILLGNRDALNAGSGKAMQAWVEVGFEEVKIFLKFPLTFSVRSANLSSHTEKIITK